MTAALEGTVIEDGGHRQESEGGPLKKYPLLSRQRYEKPETRKTVDADRLMVHEELL